MNEREREDLEKAYRQEKDHRVVVRMLAVHMVRVRNASVNEAAATLLRSTKWVHNWLRRYGEGGLDGLRDLPRSGRPPRVDPKIMLNILFSAARSRPTPAMLWNEIFQKTGARFHVAYVRKLMRGYGLSPKSAALYHIKKAGKMERLKWRNRLKGLIPYLESEGFTVVSLDEAFFIYDVMGGRKYWSPRGARIHLPYIGSHKKFTVYGAVAKDGRQFFRTHDGFSAPTFVRYLDELRRHLGKVLVIMDKASPHTSKVVEKFLQKNRDVKALYLPTGSPELNMVEECWRQAKRTLLVSEYYKTFELMRGTVSEYFRTVRFSNLLMAQYLFKKPQVCTNFCS